MAMDHISFRSRRSSPRVVITPITTVASLTALAVNNDNSNHRDRSAGQPNQPQNLRQIRELNREKLIRYVYFGQAALITIVALAWVVFSFLDLDPHNKIITTKLSNATLILAEIIENMENSTAMIISTVTTKASGPVNSVSNVQ